MSNNNRTYKRTRAKLEENPNYQFASEEHRRRHIQAGIDMEESGRFWDLLGAIIGIPVLVIVVIWIFSVAR